MPNKTAAQQREFRKKREIKDQCTYCSFPALSSMKLCAYHQEVYNDKYRKIREKRKIEGRCTRCGSELNEDADGGRRKCINCLIFEHGPRPIKLCQIRRKRATISG